MDVATIPDWLGSAVLGAVLAVLGGLQQQRRALGHVADQLPDAGFEVCTEIGHDQFSQRS